MTTLSKFSFIFLFSLFLVVNSAVSGVEIEKIIKEKKRTALLNYSNQSVKFNSQVLTKGHSDKSLEVKTFNWNNSEIKTIQLGTKRGLKAQYENSLDAYFLQIAPLHGAKKSTLSKPYRSRLHDTGRGAIIAKYPQVINGIEVFGRSISVLINRDNEYIASAGYYSTTNENPNVSYRITEEEALATAFYANTGKQLENPILDLNQNIGSPFVRLVNKLEFDNTIFSEQSRVKKVYFPITNNQIVPAYYVEADTSNKNDLTSKLFSYVIDAENGKILFSNNLTADVATTYKVFAQTSGNFIPFDGPQGNALTPHPTGDILDTPEIATTFVNQNTVTLDHAGLSTQDPWLSSSQLTTQGNNVDAYADISGANGFDEDDIRADMSGPNAFEYDFGAFELGLSGDAQKHAIVNLFFVNNFLHDWFYDNGFDELSGNAQDSNFGRGGIGGDALLVEAQDSSGVNNANMSTPSDGNSPRMQMYLWDFLSEENMLISGVNNIAVSSAEFGPSDYDVSGVMSLVDDAVAPERNGCEVISTDLTGLVAIIDRGDCNFIVKVKNAQDQGAIGVIMVNNASGPTIVQGGIDDSITIPSMMVTLEKGNEIKAALAANNSLQAQLTNQPKSLDGTLDNGIVAHEWGHYLSNRLVGNANGLTNNQGRSMGEGWSDFIAILMLVKEADNLIPGNENYQGVYSASSFIGDAYDGIRRAPYSTDLNKNALTFRHIENGVGLPLSHPISFGIGGADNAEVHRTGEIWANVLWEVYVGLLNKPGNSFAQAQEQMKDYLVASLKITPNSPTMLEARDALLATALANNAEDFHIVRDAFSKRGMGASAIGPHRDSSEHENVVEDFGEGVDLQAFMSVDATTLSTNGCDQDSIFDVGETVRLNFSLKNFSSQALPQFDINLSSANDVSFSESVISINPINSFGGIQNQSVDMTLNSAGFLENLNIVATIPQIGANINDFIEPNDISVQLDANFDFQVTSFSDDMTVASASYNDWHRVTRNGVFEFEIDNGGWYGQDSGREGESELVSPTIQVASSGEFQVSFDHFYFFESSEDNQGDLLHFDAGVIEVSVDNGVWTDVLLFGANMTDGYNGIVETTNPFLSGRFAFTNTRDVNDLSMQNNQVIFPDGLVNGQNIRIRFRIGTDQSVGEYGWLIDNFVVTNAVLPVFSEIVAEDNLCSVGSAPVVSAGDDILLISRDGSDVNVTLAGSAVDADNDVLSIEWIQRSGPMVSIANANSLNASFVFPSPSTDTEFQFELTADDGTRVTSDLISVNINLNRAPVANAVGGAVVEGQTFQLSANASDNENDSLSFLWSQASGPMVSLSSSTEISPSFTAPQVDATTVLRFDLVVSDGTLDSAITTASVSVSNQIVQVVPNDDDDSGGGGSLSLFYLIMLTVSLGIRRRMPYDDGKIR